LGLTPRLRIRITPRVVAFGVVAAVLLGMAVFVIFQAGTYSPNLPSNCESKRDPNPFFPIPWIVIGSVVAFVIGGVAARVRARIGGSR
jgi:uncharacterized PurR-regulated membrane protein YhhQ (DUF165 family)